MKWFKHDCDASEDSRIKKLKHKFGIEGYGIFFNTLELIGRKMEKNISSFGFLPKDWDDEALEIEFGLSSDKVRTIFDYMCKIGLFEEKEGRIYNGKIVERCDDYTSRIVRLKQFSNSKYEHSTNSVRTKSDFVRPRLDIDKNKNKNKNRIESVAQKKISYLKNMNEETITELNKKFGILPDRIREEKEKAIDWLSQSGRVMKDYRAFFNNWLRRSKEGERTEGRRIIHL